MTYSSCDRETFEILSYIMSCKKQNSILRALLIVRGVYISEKTNSKSSLAVNLRGQPTFYDQWFVRYGL